MRVCWLRNSKKRYDTFPRRCGGRRAGDLNTRRCVLVRVHRERRRRDPAVVKTLIRCVAEQVDAPGYKPVHCGIIPHRTFLFYMKNYGIQNDPGAGQTSELCRNAQVPYDYRPQRCSAFQPGVQVLHAADREGSREASPLARKTSKRYLTRAAEVVCCGIAIPFFAVGVIFWIACVSIWSAVYWLKQQRENL